MPVGLPERENITTAGDAEKNDVIFLAKDAHVVDQNYQIISV